MAKKHKKVFQAQEADSPTALTESISRRGKMVIAAGIGTLIAGFIVLSFVDAMARNWAGAVSPFLILGGYALVGIGIFLPDPAKAGVPGPSDAGLQGRANP